MKKNLYSSKRKCKRKEKDTPPAPATPPPAARAPAARTMGINAKAVEMIDQYFTTSSKSGQEKDAPFDIRKFWLSQKTSESGMFKMALKHLPTPASSVYSERLFSEFGLIYEKKRSQLLPMNSSKMLFLHHNYPIFEIEEE